VEYNDCKKELDLIQQKARRSHERRDEIAGGKDMDAIVVDTKQTGFEYIKYLRDHAVGAAMFLPLDSLQIPSPESTERLRGFLERDGRYLFCADVNA
jgi:structural maintenance of chromosome 1